LPDVIALTLAFLPTKRDDPRATGRFGTRLKTLNQIGGPLEVHSPPYHFQIDRGVIGLCEPAALVRGLWGGGSRDETLLSSLVERRCRCQRVDLTRRRDFTSCSVPVAVCSLADLSKKPARGSGCGRDTCTPASAGRGCRQTLAVGSDRLVSTAPLHRWAAGESADRAIADVPSLDQLARDRVGADGGNPVAFGRHRAILSHFPSHEARKLRLNAHL